MVAPHPDDETMGCGGTLLKHRAHGDQTHWLIVTAMTPEGGFSPDAIERRKQEIERVRERFGFESVHELGLPTAQLDTLPLKEIVQRMGTVVRELRPHVLYIPFRYDAHSDHRVVFDAISACTKSFRYPGIKRVLAYETLSETEFGMDPVAVFRPNVFVDVSEYLDEKVNIMAIYKSEFGEFPFPRSEQAIRALAALRGSTSGAKAAEAFLLLREVW